MSISCKPGDLLVLAKDYLRFSEKEQDEVKSYLLCQYANKPKAPTPTGLTLSLSVDGLTLTTSWDALPAGVTTTQIWTSSDGITYALEQTIAAPAVTTNLITPPATGATKYVELKWCIGPDCGAFCAPQFIIADVVNEWVHRVMLNGGAQPSNGTINAARTFYNSLVTASLWNQFIIINMIAPDSSIAAKTPLLNIGGSDPWTGGANGVLSINGWISGGGGTSLHTGYNASAAGGFSSSNACWIAYIYNGVQSNVATACLGCRVTAASTYFMCNPNSGNLWYGWCFTNDASSLLGKALPVHPNGLWALTRRANNILEAYRGQATFAPGTMELEFSSAVVGTANPPNAEYYVCGENLDGVDTIDVARTISFFAFANGLTGAQLQTVYTAVTALRQAFGGGWV